MNIRETLENHEVYMQDKEALAHAETAVKDFKKRTGGGVLSDEGRNLLQGQYTTIGASIVRRYAQDGGIRYIGEKAESPAKLAALMQAHRNPLFETLRIIYMKEGYVAAAESYSNHLPNYVFLPYKNEELITHIQEQMQRLSADGYYLAHNHPSGNPTPSLADRQLTYVIMRHVDGYQGHIITNHMRYALLDDNADWVIHQMEPVGKDPFMGASIAHPLIDKKVNTPAALAEAGRELQTPENDSVSSLIYCSADSVIRMVQEISNSIFFDPQFRDWLAGEIKSVGACNACCITSNTQVYESCEELIIENYLKDSIFIDLDYPFYWSKCEQGIRSDEKYLAPGITKDELKHYTTFQTVKTTAKETELKAAQPDNKPRGCMR
ncbi:JAB domain-containing protein [Ihubacter sp. mB4P-1]|uniref:JAB domain-containing protein n=1 Tax=Ihubacter sp. mB4P-1 TaxID=3242370 RepID=UPI0021746491|nr:hypothetical protein [Emergencia sp.]